MVMRKEVFRPCGWVWRKEDLLYVIGSFFFLSWASFEKYVSHNIFRSLDSIKTVHYKLSK